MDHDVAVIGRGLIGAAAARHLGEAGLDTVVVGPDEPEDRRRSPGPFCSHPDEGRITRIAGRTPIWSELAARSIARYADIEARSGTAFHTPVGLAAALPTAADWVANSHVCGGDAQLVERGWLYDEFGIALDNGHPALFEPAPAGHINPRRLVRAQTELCERAGVEVRRDAVERLARVRGGFELTGRDGTVRAHRVLVATGAFGAELLERPLMLQRFGRTTVTAELEASADLPSLILNDPPDDRLASIYWVPPVRYADGRVALKIGGDLVDCERMAPEHLGDWFRGDGDPVEVEALRACVEALLPDSTVSSWAHKPCVVTNTVSGHPYVGWVESGVAVAIGGNGSAAKSSDEIGRLAASLFCEDGWTDSIPPIEFAPMFER